MTAMRDIARAAVLESPRMSPAAVTCHACDAPIEGEAPARGLLLFVRGDAVEREEPPLCARCAHAIRMTALSRWEIEEDEG